MVTRTDLLTTYTMYTIKRVQCCLQDKIHLGKTNETIFVLRWGENEILCLPYSRLNF